MHPRARSQSRLVAILAALALCTHVVLATGCGALGAGRAIDEAEGIVARLPCKPPGPRDTKPAPCLAAARTIFFAVSARGYLAEAHARVSHGDHGQAERFAVLARKAAEEALRLHEGL